MSDIPGIFSSILDRQTAARLDGQARALRNRADHAPEPTRRQLIDRAADKEAEAKRLRGGR